MKNSYRILAALLLVIMLSPIVMTEGALATYSTATGMHKTEDIFLGSFSPSEVTAVANAPFAVSFTVRPKIDAPDTTVHFVLPADLVTLVEGDATWQGDLKKGEKLTLSLSLAPHGKIEADVKANVETTAGGKDYRNSYYLHVAVPMTEEEKHKVITVKPESLPKTRSPLSPRVKVSITSPAGAAPAGPGAGQIEVKGSWWYVNDEGGWSPGRYMLAELWDAKTGVFVASQWTGGDGSFDFIVNNVGGGRNPYLRFFAEGAWDWITTDTYGNRYNWATGVLGYNVPDLWVYNTGNIAPGSNGNALMAGDAVFSEMNWVYWNSGVNWERPTKVTVRWPRETWPHSHGDYIDLPTSGWDHVTVLHESGHCVLWTCYGNSWPEGSAFCEHWIGMEDPHLADAWDEGWAEFMEAVVDNDPNNVQGNGQNLESNDWFNWVDTGDKDGANIEGEVASILWDIWDPVNIAGDDDHMGWGYEEIFTVLRYGDAGADDNPNSILEFWDDWASRWPTNSTSMGPLCDIYYNYGIDKDWYNPWGAIIINGGALYTTSRTVTLTLSGDDWGVGVQYMRFSEDWGATWGGWYDYSTTFSYTIASAGDGYKYIDVQFADFWWLSNGGTIYDGITLDTVAPTGTVLISSGAIYTTSRTCWLNLTASDATSGVAKVRFSENMGAWTQWYTYATTFPCILNSTGDAYKMIDVQFQDHAGNNSTAWTLWDGITLDTTAPTGGIVIFASDPPYTTTQSVLLFLNYSDATSGVYQVRYGNSGGVWSAWEAPNATKWWNLTAGDGTKTVWYQIMDNAGLTSTMYSDSIVLDTTPPTGSIVANAGNPPYTVRQSVTLYLTYNDATSGVYQVRYSNDGVWDTEPWEAPAATKAWTLSAGNGNKTLYYQIKDNAGLISQTYKDWIVLQNPMVNTWFWSGNTTINSVASADVDGDGQVEVVTGGYYYDGTRNVAQLAVWAGSDLSVDRMTTWYWTGNTQINSVAIGDVDADGQVEIVTGGSYFDGTRNVAQLAVWNGANLAVDRLTTWYWTGNTVVNSVAIGDVDADGQVEIVTGGYYNDGTRNVAQLVVWTGSALAVDRLTTWYWTGNTVINSVAIGNVDADGQVEIVTGGSFFDGTRNVAQLVVWNGANLAVDRLTSWYWTSNTAINSVAIGDVDADGQTEIVTGGYYNDGTRNVAQLVVWTGSALAVDRLTSWYWTGNTVINSVGLGDADGDGQVEIVTGGYYNDGTRNVAQLVSWSGSSLAAENIKTWYWVNNTQINSVCLRDINGDVSVETVTGGAYYDGTRWNAQLTVWGM